MQLAYLTPLYERPGPWASVHVDTEWTDESTSESRELQAREACRQLIAQGADEPTGQAVYEALAEPPHPTGESGRAVFATHGEVVLDTPLGTRPAAPSNVFWSPLPRVAPLLDLAVQEPVCLVVYIDRKGADLELRTSTGARAMGKAQGTEWPIHRTTSSDWSERRHQWSAENTWEQSAGEIAAVVAMYQEEIGADLIVLAGDARGRRSVHRQLPAALQPHVVETEHGGRAAGSTTRLLDEELAQARRRHLELRAEEELDRFRSAVDSRAQGVPALVEAAREHRIAELFVRPEGADVRQEVWVGGEPDQLAVRRTDSQYLGAPQPASARADDALLRSAAMNAAEVLRVPPEGHDDLPAGGLGALLRWPRREGERE